MPRAYASSSRAHAESAAGREQAVGFVERAVDRRERVGGAEQRDHARLATRLRSTLAVMVWFFERHGTYIRCETREANEAASSLLIIHPDGTENVERFEDSASLTRRQQELESHLTHDGWTGPFGRTI